MMADKQMTDFLAGVVGAVEANSFEKLCLWQDYTARGTSWKENSAGLHETIGMFNEMPVCLSLFTAEVDGHKLLFFDAVSQVVDHRMVEKWLADTLPSSAKRRGSDFINKTDAMNFHNVLPRVDVGGARE